MSRKAERFCVAAIFALGWSKVKMQICREAERKTQRLGEGVVLLYNAIIVIHAG